MDKQVHIGHIVSSDTLGLSLHDTAKSGKKKRLKNILKKGIYVDYPNDEGQSALFCACCEDKYASAQLLLKFGANPNERSNCGMTPLHMACYSGNTGLLVKLIEAGGDLRLHDYDGRSAKDWAVANRDPKKRGKMVEFLEKAHMYAMTHSGRDATSTRNIESSSHGIPSVIQILKKRIGIDPSVHIDPLKRVQSMGFGSVYFGGEAQGAVVSAIPVVSENALYHDTHGVTYENGSFLVMESMTWNHTPVTVKRLHKQAHPGGYVDVLINEMEQLGKIRHPNVLLLMGICQTTSLDSIVLVFERIYLGSLFYYMHQRFERLPTQNIRDILLQICSALMFLHNQNYIHCNLSSHAINLVTPFNAKLGNFEHMIDSGKADMGKQSAVSQIRYQNALYNWMAPELMQDHPATFLCDVYSYCSIIWEMFECEIPWDMSDAELIKHKLLVEKQQLRIESAKIPKLFKSIVSVGLELEPYNRNADFDKMHQWLLLPPDEPIANTVTTSKASPSKYSTGRRSKPTSATSSPSRHGKDSTRNHSPSDDHVYMEEYSPNGKRKKPHTSRQDYHNENYHNLHSPRGKAGKGTRVKIVENDISQCDSRKYDKTSHGKIPFSAGQSDWMCNYERNQDADFYSYKAKLQKDTRQSAKYDEETTSPKEYVLGRSSETCSGDDDNTTTLKQYLRKKAAAKYYADRDEKEALKEQNDSSFRDNEGSPILSPPLSPSQFSYLRLSEESTGGQSVVKPASHCTEAGCPKSSGQLTTAGSLFALYNSGTDHHEFAKLAIGAPANPYGTFPRKRKSTQYFEDDEPREIHVLSEQEADPNWFGGKGSVKNLVHLFQEQNDDHEFQQKVLEGKVDYGSTVRDSMRKAKTPDRLYSRVHSRKSPVVKGLEYQQFVEMSHPAAAYSTRPEYKDYTDYIDSYTNRTTGEKHTGHLDADSQCSYSSESTSSVGCNPDQCSSVDSDLVSSWIADQLQKAKADVAREIASEYERQREVGLLDEIMEEMSKSQPTRPDKKQVYGYRDLYEQQKKKQEFDLKEFYIDDDINNDPDERSHIRLQGGSEERGTDYKDWKYQAKSKSDNNSGRAINAKKKNERKHTRESGIPKPKVGTRLMSTKQTGKPTSKGFTTTVTVESSLINPGEHQVRHTATDLATGETTMLHEERVQAANVHSKLQA
ncbi:uncharacterized protein LOC124150879 isoform X2 [Haliotis rufescens]|uniref:uncharacterized protein LOC124150879 isoform X2 n=1 Tax=Haliotis rufescens TaxID=6454 RepID=UPI00201EA30E|nr:uncharacterized protein LOC124150879 isoform X2 [Haliotis rufescens]